MGRGVRGRGERVIPLLCRERAKVNEFINSTG